jgi:hypothetical protein
VVSFGVSPPNRLVALTGDYTTLNFHHFRDGTVPYNGKLSSNTAL